MDLIGVGIVIAIIIGIMLICRSIVIWWTGISDVIKILKETNERQAKQMKELIEIQKDKIL